MRRAPAPQQGILSTVQSLYSLSAGCLRQVVDRIWLRAVWRSNGLPGALGTGVGEHTTSVQDGLYSH